MNVQLLLLLALVGPFCGFTHANPTPTHFDVGFTGTVTDASLYGTEGPKEAITSAPHPSATEVATAPAEIATEAVTDAAPPSVTVNTEETVTHRTEAPHTAAAEPGPLITDAPAVETAAPTEAAEKDQHVVTAPTEAGDEVLVEDGSEEGLSSGQVVGIVIGALLAVVIVIAVVIAAVRRMGKYSSAKNKKPAKKDSVMVSPLRKKSAKQQERPKFWKF